MDPLYDYDRQTPVIMDNPHHPIPSATLPLHSHGHALADHELGFSLHHVDQMHHDQGARARPPPPPLDMMRAYRACLNCRNRKTRCDLDINGGRPPCRRCHREDKNCVLGESHRGGRRVRKKPKSTDFGRAASGTSSDQVALEHRTRDAKVDPSLLHSDRAPSVPFSDEQNKRVAWKGRTPASPPASDNLTPGDRRAENSLSETNVRRSSGGSSSSLRTKISDENIASANLQHPSDALEILAHVADRAEGDPSTGVAMRGKSSSRRPSAADGPHQVPAEVDNCFHYQPVIDGKISTDMIYHYFAIFQEFYHPFFPITPPEIFERQRLPWTSRAEPTLFSAIMSIASRNDEAVHQICRDHMLQLQSKIADGAAAGVEAVEAFLILAQWASQRPQAQIAIGRGEEDRVAWMYTGKALRLGYYLQLDRTSFRGNYKADPTRGTVDRQRLVWAACYMSDRQVSCRIGRGFWSRGPGPLSGTRWSEFPPLQPKSPNDDNLAWIFEANLGLTQIFSNVHDQLYSVQGQRYGWDEMLEGRYAKHLDDFRDTIWNWKDTWGDLICSRPLKASLQMTYDYLRLYVNAFAYQTTISRELKYPKDARPSAQRHLPIINASAPDARFIFEALDAAKSVLSTFNVSVEPETLRCMPTSYYLYIIYSAVFLYKAIWTTTMSNDEYADIRRMIDLTISRLAKSSTGANHMGDRYSRLVKLLWRKAPKNRDLQSETKFQSMADQMMPAGLTVPSQQGQSHGLPGNEDPANMQLASNEQQQFGNGTTAGTFSWLDLGATWNFATQNNSQNGSVGEPEDMWGDAGMGNHNHAGFDMNMTGNYGYLNDASQTNLLF